MDQLQTSGITDQVKDNTEQLGKLINRQDAELRAAAGERTITTIEHKLKLTAVTKTKRSWRNLWQKQQDKRIWVLTSKAYYAPELRLVQDAVWIEESE